MHVNFYKKHIKLCLQFNYNTRQCNKSTYENKTQGDDMSKGRRLYE
jgi:hypothetical protein